MPLNPYGPQGQIQNPRYTSPKGRRRGVGGNAAYDQYWNGSNFDFNALAGTYGQDLLDQFTGGNGRFQFGRFRNQVMRPNSRAALTGGNAGLSDRGGPKRRDRQATADFFWTDDGTGEVANDGRDRGREQRTIGGPAPPISGNGAEAMFSANSALGPLGWIAPWAGLGEVSTSGDPGGVPGRPPVGVPLYRPNTPLWGGDFSGSPPPGYFPAFGQPETQPGIGSGLIQLLQLLGMAG